MTPDTVEIQVIRGRFVPRGAQAPYKPGQKFTVTADRKQWGAGLRRAVALGDVKVVETTVDLVGTDAEEENVELNPLPKTTEIGAGLEELPRPRGRTRNKKK
jgi:hypothetical protein